MIPRLTERAPKRVFTFGCSFTHFSWPTWADIVAHDMGVPFYNYGKEGAGNLYIHNHVMQADAALNFNQDDLVMICWSSVNREDRWCRKFGWLTPGNVFNTTIYGEKWLSEFADPYGYAIRDYALLKSTVEFLRSRGCQFHMFSMAGLEPVNEWIMFGTTPEQASELVSMYRPYLDVARPSMYELLWGGEPGPRVTGNQRDIHPGCMDGHPHVKEHLEYLEKAFAHEFSQDTRDMVARADSLALEVLKEIYVESNGDSTKTRWEHIEERVRAAGLWLGSHLELEKITIG